MIRLFVIPCLLTICVGGVSMSLAASGAIPGPRKPLTTSDFGLYGGWNDYFFRPDTGFDFLVMQALVPANPQTSAAPIGSHGQAANVDWNQSLLAARRAGKRVIADVMLGIGKPGVSIATLERQLDYFMAHVDEAQLYAITLAEENVYWDGARAQLIALYHYAKSKYDVPVYQWYSPYAGTPGFGWPTLPADGWILDEYAHLMPDYERFVREYKMTGVPLVSIVWAAPSMKDFQWKGRGDIALPQQLEVHRKYGIPSAFFCWSGKANIWSWNLEAPSLDREVFAAIRQNIKRLRQRTVVMNPDKWDQPEPSVVPLACQLQPAATFDEDYAKNGGRLVESAGVVGFRRLRYRGQGVEFAPDSIGPAHAAIIYRLGHPFPPRTLSVRVHATAAQGATVKLALSVSGDGKQWSVPVVLNRQGMGAVTVQRQDPILQSHTTWVKIDLDGQSERANQALLTINSLTARSTFSPTSPSAIKLTEDAARKMEYKTNFDDLSWLHTARIDRPGELSVRPGGIGQGGQQGHAAAVSIIQAFAADRPMIVRSLSIRAEANEPDLGAIVQLGISVDGRKPLIQTSTSGRFNNTLSLDARALQSLGANRQVYVHLTLINRSGVKTAPAWVKGLALEAIAQ
jgi:hypothetical protein